MSKLYATLLGKTVKSVMKLRGGGSALPGLIIERIDPNFTASALSTLPHGVVVISGTNGKTTTTKMVVELLESQGLNVFTNRTGSNFTRGVAAALLGEVNLHGMLSADIAVLEIDEAHAVHFIKSVPPSYSLLLNVMRDQLDRFGEIDTTAEMLSKIAHATTGKVVINREDPRLRTIAAKLDENKLVYFGLDASLTSLFPSDDEMRGSSAEQVKLPVALGVLKSVDGQQATLNLNGESHTVTLQLDGAYNIFNAVAALSLVSVIVGNKLDTEKLITKLESITPAFGRGEKLMIDGQPLELVLVKNPSGFRLGLSSFSAKNYATMIAINDNYADGRDMSWLWDVDFDSLKESGVVQVSGIRAYDMALRLQYDEVEVQHVEPRLSFALKQFLKQTGDSPKRIYCTYTAMLALRKELSKITQVEVVS